MLYWVLQFDSYITKFHFKIVLGKQNYFPKKLNPTCRSLGASIGGGSVDSEFSAVVGLLLVLNMWPLVEMFSSITVFSVSVSLLKVYRDIIPRTQAFGGQ